MAASSQTPDVSWVARLKDLPHDTMPNPADITLRPLQTREECEACVRLQRQIWGEGFVDVVPATILMVSQRVGGVAAGAFNASRRLIGFVFGISACETGSWHTGRTCWRCIRRPDAAGWPSG